jgi:hypothetical protein
MSYSKQTGLAYIPTFNLCMDIAGKTESYTPGKFYLASEFDLDKADAGGHSPSSRRGTPVKQAAVRSPSRVAFEVRIFSARWRTLHAPGGPESGRIKRVTRAYSGERGGVKAPVSVAGCPL